MKNKIIIPVALIVSLAAFFLWNFSKDRLSEGEVSGNSESSDLSSESFGISEVATGLEVPWGLVFLPDEGMLFTERAGRVKHVVRSGEDARLVATVTNVRQVGESGLLGIELHPNFVENRFVYLYYTFSEAAGGTMNRVSRFVFEGGALLDEKVILDSIPGATTHDGGRIKFGPDSFLYVTTGDAQDPSSAQDTDSLAGKILRITDEGQPAPGNPFGNSVYSFGHRNPQGLAWDNQGRLWATEHGSSAFDELNLIERGANYGWPEISGGQERQGMRRPRLHSGTSTWAPSGMVFIGGNLYFAGLRGSALFSVDPFSIETGESRHFEYVFGRIRDVVAGPDGFLYILTNNRDGRGVPREGDDKIIRIDPRSL